MNKKKKIIRQGFFTRNGKPTQNALLMYFVYLKNLPEGWSENEINKDAVWAVKAFFGWSYETGFDVMIKWGIDVHCGRSQTSDGRHLAMSLAYHDALGMMGQGYNLCLDPIE